MAEKKPNKRIRGIRVNRTTVYEFLKDIDESFHSARAAALGGVSPETWRKLDADETGIERFDLSTVRKLARLFGKSIRDLENADDEGCSLFPELTGWEVTEPMSDEWEKTSNGLCFFRCKVQNLSLSTCEYPSFGRARIYNLMFVPDARRSQMLYSLERHASLCHRLRSSPLFVNHLVTGQVTADAWWVVDEWLESETLQNCIKLGWNSFDPVETVREIARGLEILHKNDIVVRELAPSRLLLTADGQLKFTDLDLAKLLDGAKTVSTEWPVDAYRAPEIESGESTPQSDFYSWGMIALRAVTGDLSLTRRQVDAIDESETPANLKAIVKKCLSPSPQRRPKSVAELIRALD